MRRAALAAALLLGLAGCTPAEVPGAEPAPEFALDALDGTRVALAELRGEVVVVDFWATWCAPCVFQVPVLNDFWERHRGSGVRVLGISVDTGGPGVVEEFARDNDVRYPVLLGDEDLAQRYGAIGYPSLYVIAPDGSIATSHVGLVSEQELEEAVRRARRQGAATGDASGG